jgi:hypothetical protein
MQATMKQYIQHAYGGHCGMKCQNSTFPVYTAVQQYRSLHKQIYAAGRPFDGTRPAQKGKPMKQLISSCALLATVLIAAPAMAANAGSCASLSQQLQKKSAEFVRVNAEGRNPFQSVKATPADFHHGISQRDSALHTIANDVWTLRAEMASRDCAQAKAFAY